MQPFTLSREVLGLKSNLSVLVPIEFKLITVLTKIFTTPRKPCEDSLKRRWSKTCTIMTLCSVTHLNKHSNGKGGP